MAKPRKTVPLRALVDWVNERNRTSTCEPAVRAGWNSLVSSFLMEADVYGGFNYLTANELEAEAVGQPPGIVPHANGHRQHEFPDESRVRFLILKGL